MKSAVRVAPFGASVRPVLRTLVFFAGLFMASFAPLFVAAENPLRLAQKSADPFTGHPGFRAEGARRLALNGAELWFRTETLDQSLEAVLTHYRSICGVRARMPLRASGHVACVGAASDESLPGLVRRFSSFARSGDLADLGGLRFALVRRVLTRDGPAAFVLTMWTDSSLRISSLLPPREGDAPGRDPQSMPRPRRSQRVLSASEVGAPSGVFVYRVGRLSPEAVAVFYRRELPATGWRLVHDSSLTSYSIDEAHVVSAERRGVLLTAFSHRSEVSGVVLTVLTTEEPS